MEVRIKKNLHKINHQIRVNKIRLIDANGDMIGLIDTNKAIYMAQESGLDLVEISPNAVPPVCKILDYGKFRYQEIKRSQEARKKQKIIVVKEIKIRPNIGVNDLEIKIKHIEKFIKEGDKVKVQISFRGREITHKEIGHELMQRILSSTEGLAETESMPKFYDSNMIMVLIPKKEVQTVIKSKVEEEITQ